MKKGKFAGLGCLGLLVIGIIALAIILGGMAYRFNNKAVVHQEDAITSWSNVESSYQRRNDLIGNLVKTVQGAADFEKETLEGVINARAEATKTTINAGDLTPENMAKFQQAQSGLTGALSKLMVVVERYPDLKANQNFLSLQSQLEGTENRINVVRDRFNESVNVYNKFTKIFPNNLFARVLGFEEMTRYKSDAGSEVAPEVDFDFGNKKD